MGVILSLYVPGMFRGVWKNVLTLNVLYTDLSSLWMPGRTHYTHVCILCPHFECRARYRCVCVCQILSLLIWGFFSRQYFLATENLCWKCYQFDPYIIRKGRQSPTRLSQVARGDPFRGTRTRTVSSNDGDPSSVASEGGMSASVTAKILPIIGEKGAKFGKMRGNGNIGKEGKNREEKAKIGKVLSLFPSWQRGLATPLANPCYTPWFRNR